MPRQIGRAAYADMFGPTVGDRVRLADTELIIEVEKDLTIYGEEVKFGGGKVIRDGMGQRQATRARGRRRHRHHQRADRRPLGHRQGRHRPARTAASPAIGKAGNPDIQPGVDIVIGPGTEVDRRRGQDRHRRRHRRAHPLHLPAADRGGALCPASPPCSAAAPARRPARNATTCTPGALAHRRACSQAAEAFPMNLGFFGKGNAAAPEALVEQIAAGACGAQAARGLGHHAGRDRLLPVGRRRASTCRWRSTPTR